MATILLTMRTVTEKGRAVLAARVSGIATVSGRARASSGDEVITAPNLQYEVD